MKASSAERLNSAALQDLGRSTLRIVHDLKNQLNGLKLYATFLRKRLDRHNCSPEERETIDKLVAGLDRAARDLTVLVRYAQPLDLRQQPNTDLRMVLDAAVHEPYRVTGALSGSLLSDRSGGPLVGRFDPHALAEAFSALAREASGARPADQSNLSLHAFRSANDSSADAIIEWRGLSARNGGAEPGIHAAFATRVIEAHGGTIEFDHDKIRVTLPLSE